MSHGSTEESDDEPRTLSEDDLDGVLAWTAIRVGRRMERLLTDLLAEHHLTPVQFGVLAQLGVHHALAQADLARAIGIRAQSTRQVVGEMEARGLLERLGPGGRGRRTAIELTDAGRDLLARTWPLVDRAGTGLPPQEEADLNARLLHLLHAPPPSPPGRASRVTGDTGDPPT